MASNESETLPKINNGSLFTKYSLGKIHGTYVFSQLLITELKTGTVPFLLIFQTDKKKEHNASLPLNTKKCQTQIGLPHNSL